MPIRDLAASEDGKSLLVCSEDSVACVVSLNSEQHTVINCLPGHEGSIKACAMHPGGKYAATAGCDGYVSIYGAEKGELLGREKVAGTSALAGPLKLKLAWSKDGSRLFVPGDYVFRYMLTGQWSLIPINEMISNKEISLIEPIDKGFVFALTVDNEGAIWDFESRKQLASINMDSSVLEAKYEPSSKCLSLLTRMEIVSVILEEDLLKVADEDVEMKEVEEIHDLLLEEEKELPERDFAPRRESQFALLFDVPPQEPFQVNATQYNNSLRFLCWNSVGSITLLSRINSVSISFNFADTTSQRNFIIPDELGVTAAAMCSLGAVLSNAPQDEGELEGVPAVQFVPFHTWRQIKTWKYELGAEEVAKALAIGSHWAAVATSKGYVRVFSHEGVQKRIFCMEGLVTMCGYENLLAIVYHQSAPLSGSQRMGVRMVDVKDDLRVVLDAPVALSSEATIKWIGFSEEGQLFTYDTDGMLRGLVEYQGSFWIPTFDYKLTGAEGEFWVVSVLKNSVLGVELKGVYDEPTLLDKEKLKEISFNFPAFQNTAGEECKFNIDHIQKTLELKQASHRRAQWELLKLFRKKNDPEYKQSISIPAADETAKLQKSLDILLIDKIRQCCIKGESKKAIAYAEMMQLPLSVSLVTRLCQKLGKDELASRIGTVLEVLLENTVGEDCGGE
eukprot:TRINITY_DN1520_c0_g1_i9.p1 TRINITY_DN1520_c0_g1~~TRINITY_DN1520_c0_g1_i9.p1  ORF type:complete len:676 (+),score=210.29 TRINITY_DN1520_c0_g1_i9:102-2129(+)